MSFKHYLSESKQVGTLYHFTSLDSIEEIMKSDKLVSGNNFQNKKVGNDVISTTRSKHGVNIRGTGKVKLMYGRVRIELEGDKLSNNFKIQSSDFHGDLDNFEELVFAKEIKPLSKYIKRVVFVLRKDTSGGARGARNNKRMIEMAESMKNKYSFEVVIETGIDKRGMS